MNRGIYLFVVLALLFSGCRKKYIEVERETAPKKIEFALSIANVAPTRAPQLNSNGSGQFSTGDQLLIMASTAGKHQALNYTVGETTLTWSALLGFPRQDVKFTGCYPRLDFRADGSASFTIADATSVEADLLLAQGATAAWESTTPIPLSFKHAMHKLHVTYRSSDNSYSTEQLNGITLRCTAESSCRVDLLAGRVKKAQTPSPRTYSTTGNNASLLLVPQPTDGVTIKLVIGGKEYAYSLPATTPGGEALTELMGGKSLTVSFDVKSGGAEPPAISISAGSIAGWEPQGEVEGEVIVE